MTTVPERRGGAVEKIGTALFVAMLCFLAFVGGALLVISETPPHRFFRDAYMAGAALFEQRQSTINRYGTDLWREARREDQGVTIHDQTRAFEGYTLYTSGDAPSARLIDMDGTLVHEWTLPYSEIWDPETARVEDPQPDELTYMDYAMVQPNGDLIAIYTAAGDSPYGYGMVKMDRDSRPVWTYLGRTHHQFDVGPDGRIYALIHEFVPKGEGGPNQIEDPYLADYLVVLSPEGEEEARIPLLDAMLASPFRPYVFAIPQFSSRDPTHTNTVQYIDETRARAFPFAEEGDIMVSFRDMGVVAVLDLESEEIVWATKGWWIGQHDPQVLPNGDVLLFDNLGRFEENNRSRVVQFDPETMEQTWSYHGTNPETPFESGLRSSIQRLPNGNTLIDESDGGRLFEVTRSGEIVWEYINPVRGGPEGDHIPVVSAGRRLAPEAFDEDFRLRLDQGG